MLLKKTGLLTAVLLGVSLAAAPAFAEVTLVDEAGRTTVLEKPIERAVVIGSYDVDIVTAIGGRDRIVGVVRVDLDQDHAAGGKWTDAWNVGEWSEINYEAIANLDPDAVVIYANGGWEEAEQQLKAFNIPVIVASGWQNAKFNNIVALLGDAFGLEDGAKKVLDFRKSIFDQIDARVASLPKRTVYYENEIANQTPTKGSGFYEAIEAGHGESIFSDVVFGQEGHTQGTVWKTPIDGAEILNRDPDLIIREFGNNYKGSTEETFAEEGRSLASRPGWSDLKAFKNDNVYVVNAYLLGQQAKTLTSLYVAAWLYPEAFADLDPDTIAKEWVEGYLGFPWKGNEGIYFRRVGANLD